MAGQGFLLKTFNFMNGWILSNNSCRVNLVALQNQNPMRTLKLETREKLKALKIPEKPKKPLTPYLQFVNEKRLVLLKDNPNLKLTEVIKKLSADWKTVSNEQKEKYNETYSKEKTAYDKEILKYNSSLNEEQRDALQEASVEKRKDRKKRKLTKLIKETDKPKRPIGPYLRFLKDHSADKNVSQKDLMANLKGEWAVLTENEKKKYKDAYSKEMVKFEETLKQWEKKMLAEGHKDIVRQKTIQELENRPSRVVDLKKTKPSKQ